MQCHKFSGLLLYYRVISNMLAFTAVWMHYKKSHKTKWGLWEMCYSVPARHFCQYRSQIVWGLNEPSSLEASGFLQFFISFSMRRIPKDITVCNIGRFQNVILYCMNAEFFFFHCVCVCVCMCVVGGRVGVFRRRWVIVIRSSSGCTAEISWMPF